MATKLQPCPFDASRKLKVEHFNGDYHVHCQTCGATGPLAASWDEAEQLWNVRAERKDGDGQH